MHRLLISVVVGATAVGSTVLSCPSVAAAQDRKGTALLQNTIRQARAALVRAADSLELGSFSGASNNFDAAQRLLEIAVRIATVGGFPQPVVTALEGFVEDVIDLKMELDKLQNESNAAAADADRLAGR